MSDVLHSEADDERGRRQIDSLETHYAVVAIAPKLVDLVNMAGGLLCDRAMRGWTVSAVITDCFDARPLTILGVDLCEVPTTLSRHIEDVAPRVLVIPSISLIGGDCHRDDLLQHSDFRHTQVLRYGSPHPRRSSAHDLVEHRLSPASRAFKAHAMAAAGIVKTVEHIERFVQSPALRQLEL